MNDDNESIQWEAPPDDAVVPGRNARVPVEALRANPGRWALCGEFGRTYVFEMRKRYPDIEFRYARGGGRVKVWAMALPEGTTRR